ncbi:MAG: glutamate--tRNA ligase [Rhodospirillaceae bacterium]|jgi:glutamyl-tRNA synthetase
MTVVTRFAPSPTGFLHIGGARTALFNWLYARHHGGKFLLRIEDTDRKRSTPEAVEAIYEGLSWLGLDWDGEAVSQFERAGRHREVAQALLEGGHAYRCYCSPEELTAMREKARAEGRPMRYDGTWRDRDPADAPAGVDPVIRLKAPRDGETVIEDLVQGKVTIANDQLDDMILLRADGTPTYMLAVVVDDHDMEITHVIRGDDHLNNAFRQSQLYRAMDWDVPAFAHIPLIHGADGAKMSKRHGALGVTEYRNDGMLPEALRNYLLRLGWGHGDDEIISTEQAIEWFDLDNVGKAAARFDPAKLLSLNAHYIREADNQDLLKLLMPAFQERYQGGLAEEAENRVKKGLSGLKERAKTTIELLDNAGFYVVQRPIELSQKAEKLLDKDAKNRLKKLKGHLERLSDWTQSEIEGLARQFAEEEQAKLGQIAQPLRAALTGSHISPGVFEVMEILGKNETLGRIEDALNS